MNNNDFIEEIIYNKKDIDYLKSSIKEINNEISNKVLENVLLKNKLFIEINKNIEYQATYYWFNNFFNVKLKIINFQEIYKFFNIKEEIQSVDYYFYENYIFASFDSLRDLNKSLIFDNLFLNKVYLNNDDFNLLKNKTIPKFIENLLLYKVKNRFF